jgi:hypothetical protein
VVEVPKIRGPWATAHFAHSLKWPCMTDNCDEDHLHHSNSLQVDTDSSAKINDQILRNKEEIKQNIKILIYKTMQTIKSLLLMRSSFVIDILFLLWHTKYVNRQLSDSSKTVLCVYMPMYMYSFILASPSITYADLDCR